MAAASRAMTPSRAGQDRAWSFEKTQQYDHTGPVPGTACPPRSAKGFAQQR